ncbi:hypothetical protein D3C80_2004470 [compost metagenome]
MTSIPILTNASRVGSSNMGIYSKAHAATPVPIIFPSNTTPHRRIKSPKLPHVGLCITGRTAVTVFSVNSC